jgi:photosystem II stability/assembly factor-like uncharacterized protein
MKNFLVLFFLCLICSNSICIYPQWQNCYQDDWVYALGVSDNCLFAGTYSHSVQLSTENGYNWHNANNGLPSSQITALGFCSSNVFAGVDNAGVHYSTDKGSSWSCCNNNLPSTYIGAFISLGAKLFVGTLGSGVFFTTDNGLNWTAVNNGLTNTTVTSFASSGTNLFAGTWDGVFLSTDEGQNWTSVKTGFTASIVNALVLASSNLYAGTNTGVFISTNNGTSWTPVNTGLTNTFIRSLAAVGMNVFAGTNGSGVFLTKNNGIRWVSEGLGYVYALAVLSPYIFAGDGMAGTGISRRLLSDMITDVEELNSPPSDFFLSQNYPNPFNPGTKISWQSPISGWQTLKVYDVLGSEVAVLVNEYKAAGRYDLEFNSSRLSSGVYFYQLRAGNFIDTKKMILMK